MRATAFCLTFTLVFPAAATRAADYSLSISHPRDGTHIHGISLRASLIVMYGRMILPLYAGVDTRGQPSRQSSQSCVVVTLIGITIPYMKRKCTSMP